jgi:hypothetical protein
MPSALRAPLLCVADRPLLQCIQDPEGGASPARPVEVRRIPGQHDDSSRRIGPQRIGRELLADSIQNVPKMTV